MSLYRGAVGWSAGAKIQHSEYGHVAYQIKGYEMYNDMLANSLPTNTPSTSLVWGQKAKTVFF